MTETSRGPTTIVIFGASGELTKRKIVPALYNLFLEDLLPEPFLVVGAARSPLKQKGFAEQMKQAVDQFSRSGPVEEEGWKRFAAHLRYLQVAYEDPATYVGPLHELEKQWPGQVDRIYYLATPPEVFPVIAERLGDARLTRDRSRSRIVVEKPFGRDLASARALNHTLLRYFDESQIYRIDHYLGKETVQNMLALRFANAIWEPIWDRRYIDNVQITVAEPDGVGRRSGYYERAGALRDMVQNHLLQLLCLVAMEPPVAFQGDEIRNKKVDVLKAIRLIGEPDVDRSAVRGQYGRGWIEGKSVCGYREEAQVAPESSTETFAAVKFLVDNWRWEGVPFYLRTGKRLRTHISEVSLQFRSVPHQAFPATTGSNLRSNRLTIQIEPEQGIALFTEAKEPGPGMVLRPVELRYSYEEVFRRPSPEAYETLLLDILNADPALFMRVDQVEAAWAAVMPVLDAWQSEPAFDFPNYQSGTWGPEAAVALLARDERTWLPPTGVEKLPIGTCTLADED